MSFFAPWVLVSCGGDMSGVQIAFMGGNFLFRLITDFRESMSEFANFTMSDTLAMIALNLTLFSLIATALIIVCFLIYDRKRTLFRLRRIVIAGAIITALDMISIFAYCYTSSTERPRYGIWVAMAGYVIALLGLPHLRDAVKSEPLPPE